MLLSDETPSDFQELYRKHVHDNLNLQKRLRDIDSAKRKRLREMEMDARMFQHKQSQFLKDRRRPASVCSVRSLSRPRTADSTGGSRFAVSQGCAYSFKTWHVLVDVNRDALDIYKSEVLNSEEGDYSGARKRRMELEAKDNDGKNSKNDVRRPSTRSSSKVIKSDARRPLTRSSSRQRVRTGKSRNSDLLTASGTILVNQMKSKENAIRSNVCVAKKEPMKKSYLRSATMPAFNASSKDDLTTAVSTYSPNTDEKPEKGHTPQIKFESFEDSGIDEVDGFVETRQDQDEISSDGKQDSDIVPPLPDIHCVSARLDSDYLSMRRRSYTIDNTDRPVLLGVPPVTKSYGARRGSVDSCINSDNVYGHSVDRLRMAADTSRGLRKLKLNTQMLRRPSALLTYLLASDEDPTKEIEDIRKNCRYIRTSNENSPYGSMDNTLDIDAIFADKTDE